MRPAQIALFFAPFVAYALFLWVTKSGVLDRSSWSPKVLLTLAIVSMVLLIGSFIYLAQFIGSPPGSTYVPAHVDERGNFVPGQTR